jgi:methionine aminotransferase
MQPAPSSKLPDVGTTIFTVMSQLAADHGAADLSQGFPDFSAPDGLLERVSYHLKAGHNQYAPMAGLPALRAEIARKTETLYGRPTDADSEVTVTSGATEGLFSAIEAFVHPGDEVIVFDPAFDSYDPAIRLAGGQARHLPLTGEDFAIDWQRVSDKLGARTRMLIINNPHNPTGAVLADRDIAALRELLDRHDLLVLADEVYEHMVYDGREHLSLLRYPDIAARSITVSSFGKTYHATGWKIGYVVAPPELTLEFRRIHQFVQFCVATPLQYALADFLASDPQHYLELADFYQAKRDRFCALMADSRFRLRPSAGTYFQLADYTGVSALADVEFSRELTTRRGVGCIPVSVFQAEVPTDQRLLRFCFAKHDQTLAQAAERLCAI